MTRAKMSAWLVFKRPTQETVVQPYWLPIVYVWLCVCVCVCVCLCMWACVSRQAQYPLGHRALNPGQCYPVWDRFLLQLFTIEQQPLNTESIIEQNNQTNERPTTCTHVAETHTHTHTHEAWQNSLCSLFFSLGVRLFEQIRLLLQTFIKKQEQEEKIERWHFWPEIPVVVATIMTGGRNTSIRICMYGTSPPPPQQSGHKHMTWL